MADNPMKQRQSVIYKLSCSCGEIYIGESTNLSKRRSQHLEKKYGISYKEWINQRK